MLMLLLTSMLALAFSIQSVEAEAGSIHIRADGSIDPPTAPIQQDGNVYTLTDNIYDSIVVEKDNIVIDGNSYTLQGSGTGDGIYLHLREHVTVRNTHIKNFYYGIEIDHSSYNSISGSTITNNDKGIWLCVLSDNNSISGNAITNNDDGIGLSMDSYYNSISGNTITDNDNGIALSAGCLYNSISGNNVTDNDNGIAIDGSGYNSISGNTITNNSYGIIVPGASWGDNSYSGNTIANNSVSGISLARSNDRIIGNTIANNSVSGIEISYAKGSIIGNTITANKDSGIHLYHSSDSSISENNIVNNNYGIVLGWWSSNNIISENNITNNNYGIGLFYSCSGNSLYHNNLDNTQQVYDNSWYDPEFLPSINTWDDGYPSGGNYWSDYSTRYPTIKDEYQGVNQDILGSDWIWDSPYVIDANSQDRYPFVNPWDNIPPVANAGPDQAVEEDALVTFDGSGSSDNVGIVSYVWAFTDVTPQTLTGVNPIYTFATPGIYTVTLDVRDASENLATDTVTITVLKLTPEQLTQRLIQTIQTSNLPKGTEISLTSKLEDALHLLDIGNENGAMRKLMGFISQVEALRGKKLTDEQANYLVYQAQKIIDRIQE